MSIATTQRVAIRQFRPDDVDALLSILGHVDVMRFSLSGPLSAEQVQAWLDRRLLAARCGQPSMYAVTRGANSAILGFCGFIPFDDPDGEADHELGYRYHPFHWGQGVGTEAACAVLRYGLDDLRIGPVAAVIDPRNMASRRVAEKAGMAYTGDMLYHGVRVRRYIACA